MMKALIFPNDPLYLYVEKGELKDRYFNPNNIFDEVHFITFADSECSVTDIQVTIGEAKGYIYTLPPFTIKDIFFPFPKLKQVLSLIKDLNVDVVRAFSPILLGYFTIRVAQYLKIKSVVSIHTSFAEIRRSFSSKRSILRAIKYYLTYIYEYSCYKNSSKVIGMTNISLSSVPKKFSSKCEVIYNKVYKSSFYPLDNMDKEYDFIMVGRLDEPKRQDLFLKSIAKVDKKLRGLIVGNGSKYEKLKSLAKELDLSIDFKDSISNSKLNIYYNKAKFAMQLSDYEGFGIPLLEEMMVGLPLICTDIKVFREFCKDAPIYSKNSIEDIGKSIKKLVENIALQKDMKEKSFSISMQIEGIKMEEKEANLYKELING